MIISPAKEPQYQSVRHELDLYLKKTQQAVPPEKVNELVVKLVNENISFSDKRFKSEFEAAGGMSTAPVPRAVPRSKPGELKLIPLEYLAAQAEYGAKAQNANFWNTVKDLLKPGMKSDYGTEWGVSTENLVSPKVLVDPDQIWTELAKLVPHARSEVAIQTFAWNTDSEPAQAFLGSLNALQDQRRAEKATTPVQVRIIIDGMKSGLNGNLAPNDLRKDLQEEIAKRGLDPRFVNVSFGIYEHKLGGSQHGKSAYIDNRLAFVTGSNMNDSDDFQTGEHDAAFLYGGEAPNAARVDFDDTWVKSKVSAQSLGAWVTYEPGNAPPVKHDFTMIPPWTDAVKNPKDPLDELLATMKPNVPMAYLSKSPNDRIYVRKADRNPAEALNVAMLGMINNAKNSYKFASANLNEPRLVEAIISAALRHVKVQGLATQGYEDIGQALSKGTNAQVIEKIYGRLERGFAWAHQQRGVPDAEALKLGAAEAREYFDFRWTRYDPTAAKQDVGHAPHSNHVKYSAADGEVAYNGSLNMDAQSWVRSRELGVMVGDSEIIKQWDAQLFDRDFARAVAIPDPEMLKATNLGSLIRSARLVEEGTSADTNVVKELIHGK